MKKTYELQILSQKFTIKSDDDEKHVKKVADYVNKKMHDMVTANKAVSTANVAMMAALTIADELFKTRQRKRELIGQWIGKVEALLGHL